MVWKRLFFLVPRIADESMPIAPNRLPKFPQLERTSLYMALVQPTCALFEQINSPKSLEHFVCVSDDRARVQQAFKNQSNKAAGPYGIRYEHFKRSFILAPCWTVLFKTSAYWHFFSVGNCSLLVIPKGKNELTSSSSYCRIVKGSVCYIEMLRARLIKRVPALAESR